MSDAPLPLPAFTSWPTFPFEGELRVKRLADPVDVEPPRHGEDPAECSACRAPDSAYIWVSERWRVRSLERPTGLPMVLILESRSHLDMGDLPNLLAAELGVLTVRLERAIRSLDGVARVHVNRWGDGSAHLHVWFLARPVGRLQLRGTFLSLWDDILPRIPEFQWRENLALVAAWLADFGGEALAEPPHIQWQTPAELNIPSVDAGLAPQDDDAPEEEQPDPVGLGSSVVAAETAELTTDLSESLRRARSAGDPNEPTTVIRTTDGSDGPDTGDRTVNLTAHGAGDTVRIPTARTAGGETVNLSDVAAGATIRFPTSEPVAANNPDAETTDASAGRRSGGPAGGTARDSGDGAPGGPPGGTATGDADTGPGDSDGAPENRERSGTDTGSSATMRFPTSGVPGIGAQTMVFPTGDAMAAGSAETIRFPVGAGSGTSSGAGGGAKADPSANADGNTSAIPSTGGDRATAAAEAGTSSADTNEPGPDDDAETTAPDTDATEAADTTPADTTPADTVDTRRADGGTVTSGVASKR